MIQRIAGVCMISALAVSASAAQAPAPSAIVPPLTIAPAGDGDDAPAVELRDQRITLSLYQNAALVHLQNVIENPMEDSTDFIVSLPVEGYLMVREGDTVGMSTGLLDLDLFDEHGSLSPELRESDTTTDDVLRVTLGPHATTTVEALFWVPTVDPPVPTGGARDTAIIPPGVRMLTIILGEGAPDQEVADRSMALLSLADGLSPSDSLLTFDPLPDEESDSTVTWDWSETDSAPAEVIVVRYHTPRDVRTKFDTMKKISSHARCCGLPGLREQEADDEQ
jgi:hypothetical protein